MSQSANSSILNLTNNSDSSEISNVSQITGFDAFDLYRSLENIEIMPGIEEIDNQTTLNNLISVQTQKTLVNINAPAPEPELEQDMSNIALYSSCCQDNYNSSEFEDFSPEPNVNFAHADFEKLRNKNNMKGSTTKVKKISKTLELRTSTPTPTPTPTPTSKLKTKKLLTSSSYVAIPTTSVAGLAGSGSSTDMGIQNRKQNNLLTNITISSTNTNSANIDLEIPLPNPDASLTRTLNGGANYMQGFSGLVTGLFTIGKHSTVNIYVTKCVNCRGKNDCEEETPHVNVIKSAPKRLETEQQSTIPTNTNFTTDIHNCSNSQETVTVPVTTALVAPVAEAKQLPLVPLSLPMSTATCKNNSSANAVLCPSSPFSDNNLIVNPTIVREARFNPYLPSNSNAHVSRSMEEQNQDLLEQEIGVGTVGRCEDIDILLPNCVQEAHYPDNLSLKNHSLSSSSTHLNLSLPLSLSSIGLPLLSSSTSVKRKGRGRPPKHARHPDSTSTSSATTNMQFQEICEFQKKCSSKALNTMNSKIDNHSFNIPTSRSSMMKDSTFSVFKGRGRPKKHKDLGTDSVMPPTPTSTTSTSNQKEVSIQNVRGSNTKFRLLSRHRKSKRIFREESEDTPNNKNASEKKRKLSSSPNSSCKITKRKCVLADSDLDRTKTGLLPVEKCTNLDTNHRMPVLQPVSPLIDSCGNKKNLESEYCIEATESLPRITLQNYEEVLFRPVVKSFMSKTKSESGETRLIKLDKLMRVCTRCEFETESSTTNKRKWKDHFLQQCVPEIFVCKVCRRRYLNKCSLDRHYGLSNHNSMQSIASIRTRTGISDVSHVNFTLPKLEPNPKPPKVTLRFNLKKKLAKKQKLRSNK